jgi:hypothetical protein
VTRRNDIFLFAVSGLHVASKWSSILADCAERVRHLDDLNWICLARIRTLLTIARTYFCFTLVKWIFIDYLNFFHTLHDEEDSENVFPLWPV